MAEAAVQRLVKRAAVVAARTFINFAGIAPVAASPIVQAPDIRQAPQVAPSAPGFEPRYITPHNLTASADLTRAYSSLFGKISTRLGPTNPRWSTFSGPLTPEIILGAIDQCNAGFPFLLCDMFRRAVENDAHLNGVTRQAFSPIVANPDLISPPPSLARDKTAISVANWLRAVRDQIEDFDAARFALLWAEGQGYSAAENVYGYRRVVWYTADNERISRVYCVPVKLEIVEGRAFRFDMETDNPLLWLEGDYATLPPAKFIFHVAHNFSQIRERGGFMRSCLFLHAIKQWTIRDLAEYLHIYGIPQIIAEYDPKQYAYQEAKQIAAEIDTQIGQGGIPTTPIGQFRLRNDTPLPNGALVQTEAADWLNIEITKAVTAGGPLTMGASGGSYGLGDVHAAGAFNSMVLRARSLCTSVRKGLWDPTTQLNQYRLAADIGAPPEDIVAALPWYVPQIEKENDPEKRQKIFSNAMADGFPVSKLQYGSVLQLDSPKDEEDTLRGKGTPIPSSGAVVSAVEASEGVVAPMPNGVTPVIPGAKQLPANAQGEAKKTGKDAQPESKEPASIDLTATAQAAVITVNEARAQMKLPPWPDADGQLSVSEFMAKHSTTISKATDAEDGAAPSKTEST